MAKIIIFGTNDIAQLAHFYFTKDTTHEVVAFTVDKKFIANEIFEGKPVVPFEDVEQFYKPSEFSMFIAVSYTKLNTLREEKYFVAKQKGYSLESYVSSRCSYLSQIAPGDNCFILENNTIQPFVTIGNNVTLWSGNHIGHHSTIHNHNFITSQVVISGRCTIQTNCFIGVNATVAQNVVIAKKCIIGAGAVITTNTIANGVYVPPKSTKLNFDSLKVNL
jgi:sugar O-acyltransferase (sialic acid O-acetyltransferase NeuD family)